MIITRYLSGLLAIALLAAACDDDDNKDADPKRAELGLQMRATTTQSQIDAGRAQETGLIFTGVWLGVSEIELETEDENIREAQGQDDDDDIEFEGRYTVDLIQGTSSTDFGLADILPGVYEEIEFELNRIIGDTASILITFEKPQDGADPLRVE